MDIRAGDLDDPRVVELLRLHLEQSRAETAPGSAHALDLEGLKGPDVHFWTIWEGAILLGFGGLKELSAVHGEVKSMRTIDTAKRMGVGTAMLRHVIEEARTRGYQRLSLETGSWDYFQPARLFYARHGFIECQPFGGYVLDPNSVFMTLEL